MHARMQDRAAAILAEETRTAEASATLLLARWAGIFPTPLANENNVVSYRVSTLLVSPAEEDDNKGVRTLIALWPVARAVLGRGRLNDRAP